MPQTRFVDTNPRPSKSPRHVAPSELPSGAAYPSDYGRAYATQFGGGSGSEQMEARGGAPSGHFQSASLNSMHGWTGAPDSSGIYGAPMPALATANMQEQYHFQNEPFPKQEGSGNPPTNYSWSSS